MLAVCARVWYARARCTGRRGGKNLAFLYIGYATGLVYKREHIGQAGTEKHGDDCYIGLILKCNEIKEKIRHLKKEEETSSVRGREKVAYARVAYLQVLHQVVEYSQPFWVFAILDIDQRTDFCRLDSKSK